MGCNYRLRFGVLLSGCVALGLAIASFAHAEDKVGTRKNPLKFAMVPSAESSGILTNMKPIAQCLEKNTGFYFDISVPNSYIVVVEGLGSKKVDLAFLNAFGYLLASERYGVQALLKTERHGATTYQGQFIVKEGSSIKSIADIKGKKVAYVDPASTSGHILAKKTLMDAGIKPAEEVFAGKHDVVVTMVYQGQVDVGATYHSPKDDKGEIQDARARVKTQFPDIEEKVKILSLTKAIPNDPIVVRKELAPEMKEGIKKAFLVCVKEHVEAFKGVNNSTGLAAVQDSDYDELRESVKSLKLDVGATLGK